MDAVWLENATAQALNLEYAGKNLLSGGMAQDLLRSRYLSWREQVERFVVNSPAGMSLTGNVTELQSPRHRDLVAGNVPTDQLHREVGAEVRVALAVLENHMTSLRSAGPAPAPDERHVEFVAVSGRTYSYRTDAPLGEPGSFGAVFEGLDDHGRPVAVKRVSVRTTVQHRDGDARLAEREVDIGKRIGTDDHLVPILDMGRVEGALLLIMPRASETLADLIERTGPAGSAATIDIVRQIATGMRKLAALNIVHRDIKPSNVFSSMATGA